MRYGRGRCFYFNEPFHAFTRQTEVSDSLTSVPIQNNDVFSKQKPKNKQKQQKEIQLIKMEKKFMWNIICNDKKYMKKGTKKFVS